MKPQESELQSHIFHGNYLQAFKIAQEWLQDFDADAIQSPEYQKAKEAFIYSKFLSDRIDRINSVSTGKERAELFIGSLEKLRELNQKHDFGERGALWETICYNIHQEIAQNLAKDMAGQKVYNIDESLILQLSLSLIELQNYKGAKDSLRLLHNINVKNAMVNLLLAFISHQLRDYKKCASFLREALFINPDILKDNLHFLPGGNFKRLWDALDDMSPEIKCRNFAVLAEVNGLYLHKRKVDRKELRKIEVDYQSLYQEYSKESSLKDHILPRLLHYLTWLIYYFQKNGELDKANHYEADMMKLDMEMYKLYKESFK